MTNPNAGVLHRERMRFERDFTQLPNAWLRDKRLSRSARGLLAELMTHEVGHQVSIDSLVASGMEGRDAVRRMVAELESEGYLERHRERRKGRLGGTRWVLQDPWDEPRPEATLPGLERARSTYVGKPYVGKTYVGAPVTENPTTIENQLRTSKEPATPYVGVDNSNRGPCGHRLVDDRHCEYGCPIRTTA